VVDREGIRIGGEPQLNPPVRNALTEIARDATASQRDEIERALSENADAVETLATRVLNDPEINNPIACFLSKLRNGAHRERRARTDGNNERKNLEIPWDPSLVEANAEQARALIQRLTGKPTLPDTQPADEDDDIPGYGDTP
jgi:hypothetical protein